MKELEVLYNGKPSYKIKIQNNFDDLYDSICKNLDKTYNKICIVSDDKVADLYIEKIYSELNSDDIFITSFVFDNGEASKNLDNVQKLYEHLIINHFDRSDLLIALGGGVVGDLTGFTAATYLRGIDFIQVPTTLLSFVDSSIGGKTGVDFNAYKNMVGAFHMPKLVYINTQVLNSLDDDQFSCGMGEIIKHGLIRNKSYYKWLINNKDTILNKDPDIISEMIFESCKIKKEVVEEDPTEKGIRAYLNFGHTIGHAVEKLLDYKYYHGQCVSLGMVSALYLSLKDGLISKDDYDLAINTLKCFNLPVSLANDSNIKSITAKEILLATKNDKKMVGNKVKFIVLNGIGNAIINTEYTDKDLLEAIEVIL